MEPVIRSEGGTIHKECKRNYNPLHIIFFLLNYFEFFEDGNIRGRRICVISVGYVNAGNASQKYFRSRDRRISH